MVWDVEAAEWMCRLSDEAIEDGSITEGTKVLSSTFGAGLTWGAVTLQF